MDVNPILPLERTVLLMAAVMVLGGLLAWRSSAKAGRRLRIGITAARVAGLACLAAIALNPGRWREGRVEADREWAVLADRSLSMATPDCDGASRWKAACALARRAAAAAPEPGRVRIHPFAGELEDPRSPAELAGLKPEGDATDILAAAGSLLNRYRSGNRRLAGVILLSDGRQVRPGARDDLAIRARALDCPIYTLALGGRVGRRDLALSPVRRQFVTFPGQLVRVTANVDTEGLPNIAPTLSLVDPTGRPLAEKKIEAQGDGRVPAAFEIAAGAPGYYEYAIRTPPWPGESNADNNEARFGVHVLPGRIRILLVEGLPYWDSKFLAQLLRKQPCVDLAAVFRVSADRFFRVDAAGAAGDAVRTAFPDDAAALAAYDVVMIGKGAEYVLTPDRIRLLKDFLREQGGSVIFARGKPYSGDFADAAAIEPIAWGGPLAEDVAFRPTAAGEEAGLFGDLLPGRDDPLWGRMPRLRQANACAALQPFAEVLVEGSYETAGRKSALPLVVSWRFGKGVILAVNAEGLWQWDFFPASEEASRTYREFWLQTVVWAATHREFMPGQRLSLRLSESRVLPGEAVHAHVAARTAGPAQPALRVLRGDRLAQEPALAPSGTGSNRWNAIVSLREPGTYRVELTDRTVAGPGVFATLQVAAPPAERDNVSADRDFLDALALASGGRPISASDLDALFNRKPPDDSGAVEKAQWLPLWNRWWFLLVALSCFGVEWFLRRRNGLL